MLVVKWEVPKICEVWILDKVQLFGTGKITLNLLALFYIVGSGALSYAPNLDEVANRRITNDWQLESIAGYDVLVAPVDCSLLGRNGWLFVGDRVYRAVVVDCENPAHGQMVGRGLLLDQNKPELVGKSGYLVLSY